MKKLIIIKPIYLLWTVCILALSLFGACQKEDKLEKDSLKCPVIAKEGPNDSVIGKWKLVKVEIVYYYPKTIDYSCSNIEYEFQEGGILIVTGAPEDARSYKNGQYSFEFINTELYEWINRKYTVKVGYTSYACSIQNNHMVLDNSPVDGPILYFVRVE